MYTFSFVLADSAYCADLENQVVPFPLFEVLDGKETKDYLQRVEPSPQGGKKMGNALLAAVLGETPASAMPTTPAAMPRPAKMER